LISILVTSALLFIVCEAIPKTFGVTYPMQISSAVSPLLLAILRLESPIVNTLEKTPGLILKRLGPKKIRDTDILMEDEFKSLIDISSMEGVVDESQKELIKRIFELGDKPVTDIMIPRVEMFCLPLDMPIEEIIAEVVKSKKERVPIYTEDRDDIIGILFARDLLDDAWQGKKTENIVKLLARPYFVPEVKTINGLLHDFQENRTQMAIVVDEYGGVSGLVTFEHILEHLFQETYSDDELDNNDYEKIDEDTIIVPGKMPMEQLNNLLETQLPQDEFDTIGGLVLHLFGKLPERGEEARFKGYIFRIENMGRTRILKIRIKKEQKTEPITQA
jgi:magnesium and cobalt exporter, CNNM family